MEKEEGQALLDHSSSSSSMEEANHGPRKTMSARNSTFWLQVVAQSHSDMSLQASSPSFTRSLSLPESTHSIATIPGEAVVREEDGIDSVDEVIYEHERYQIVLGWGAKGCLLPMDPKKYTNATYTMHYPIFPTIALPSASQKDGIWEWTTPWKLDIHMGTDKDGWQYASNFNHLRQGGPSCSATHRSTTFTRRRKWYRTRTLIPMSNRLVNVGVDDSLLDRKSGWLNKQGHVRKNWKRRFFVLDGSVLQYFSDDVDSSVQKSKTHKLKGEVLLFHKDTTVRYVDATLSGRDFTFAIDSGEYSLQLQASSLDEREDWVFAVEDAILCRESYTEDERTNKVRSNVERRRSLTHVYSPQTKAISTRIIKAHSENISNFVTTFKLHYTIEGAIDEPTLVGALKSFRIFVERILVKGMERYREYMIQNKQEIENTYAEARDLLLIEIERLAFLPLQDTIYNMLMGSMGEDAMRSFEEKRRYLARQPQSFFDIRPSHLSPSNWKTAIIQLNNVDNYSLPSEKGQALIDAAKSIYTLYSMEHETNMSNLAADDFLPIFIYVLACSRLRQVVLTRRVVSETMISSISMGEVGYYSTMLEAAVEFISLFQLPNEDQA